MDNNKNWSWHQQGLNFHESLRCISLTVHFLENLFMVSWRKLSAPLQPASDIRWWMSSHACIKYSPRKLTWQWNITICNVKKVFRGSIFQCYASLTECAKQIRFPGFFSSCSDIFIFCIKCVRTIFYGQLTRHIWCNDWPGQPANNILHQQYFQVLVILLLYFIFLLAKNISSQLRFHLELCFFWCFLHWKNRTSTSFVTVVIRGQKQAILQGHPHWCWRPLSLATWGEKIHGFLWFFVCGGGGLGLLLGEIHDTSQDFMTDFYKWYCDDSLVCPVDM